MYHIKKLLTYFLPIFLLFVVIPTNTAFALGAFSFSTTLPDELFAWIIKTILILIAVKVFLWGLMMASSWFLDQVFDLFVVNSATWFKLDAIQDSWDLILNIANTVFIFGLLYIAIAVIFYGISNYKRPLISLIVMAMLVNFSLFFTRVIVDTSNIVSVGVYNKMVVAMGTDNIGWYIVKTGFKDGTDLDPGDIKTNPVDDSIPGSTGSSTEDFITSEMTGSLDKSGGDLGVLGSAWNWVKDKVVGLISGAVASLVDSILKFFLNYILYALVAYVLLFISFMIVGRYIALVFIMIISPLAFASYALPKTRGWIWDPWYKELMNQAILLPTLVFFLYVTAKLMNEPGVGGMDTLIRYGVFIALLLGTIKVSGILASNISKYASSLSKLTMSGAVAGSAVAGKVVGGSAGKWVANKASDAAYNQQKGAKGFAKRRFGQLGLRLGDSMQTGTWDPRNQMGLKKLNSFSGGMYGSGTTSSYNSLKETLGKKYGAEGTREYELLSGKQGLLKDEKRSLELKKESINNNTKLSAQEKEAELQKWEKENSSRLKNIEKEDAEISAQKKVISQNLEAQSLKPSAFQDEYKKAYKSIIDENKPKEASQIRKERQENLKNEFDKNVSEFSNTLKEFNTSNAASVKDKLANTQTNVIVQGISQNKDLLNNTEFTSLINGKLADEILKNKDFKGSTSQSQQTVLEGIRDRAKSMSNAHMKDGVRYKENSSGGVEPVDTIEW